MANYVYIACSLDGFIAKPDGNLDWLVNIPNETNDDFGFAAFIDKIDGIVMGRLTFETVRTFKPWPYSKPVFVLSRTLKEVPAHLEGAAEIVNGQPEEIVRALSERNVRNLYVDGGKTIQSFLAADLIDEMIVTVIAKIIGDGIPLFGAIRKESEFRVVGTEILNPYMVQNHYRRHRE